MTGNESSSYDNGKPTHTPPSTIPAPAEIGTLAVDPQALRSCLFRDTYITLRNRTSFWYHPTYIDHVSTSGFKWNGHVWLPWGTDLDQIVSFRCT